MNEQYTLNLENRHILVTGASAGLGKATALLASRLGARVSLLARRENELQTTLNSLAGTGHGYWLCDLSCLDDIEPRIKEITAAAGPLDGLAHCAGLGQNRPLAMTKPDFVRNLMTINFGSFVELIRSAAKKRHINDEASIVGVSSVAAIKGEKAQGAYAASKAAMVGLVPPLAKELAPRRIRLNAVAFGMIKTQMYNVFKEAGGDDEILKGQYLGLGEPQDAAKVMCFLLSDYSRFITGTILTADGGYLS
ncbi:MAG: SDR family oxidoreductase [Deltaproteobacteria bacterium]|jgi:NAD(P)-dependent dehydrogenase (short-subunit alcohol dehydrogenase family)|nr:SDR family oxidoreductase [Deltaproteobacteria bacterium]